MAYKLIVSDIDGTLLRSSHRLSDRVRNAIGELQARGLKFTVASGRGLLYMTEFLPLIEEDMPVISFNGAVISKVTGETLYEQRLSAENTLRIIELGWDKCLTIAVWMDGRLLVNKLSDRVLRYQAMTGKHAELFYYPDELKSHECSKILWFDKPDSIREYIKLFNADPELSFSFTTSSPTLLEFSELGVSKGDAVRRVGEMLAIDREEIIAIGDGMNDLSMIEYAGLGVAMGNGAAGLKQIADIVTLTNDEDGLAEIIEKYMLV